MAQNGEVRPMILLAAGGTGGHLFPAFALAEELGRRGFVVDLATDMRGDRYGTGFPARTVHRVPSATLAGRSPIAAAKTAFTLLEGIRVARRVLRDTQPAAVVGFGGYPTFPPVLAARLKRIPAALHEQNAVLGRANRMLARHVDVIATSFERTTHVDGDLARKAKVTGNPVRTAVLEQAQRPYKASGPDAPFPLLIFGGSQGASFFAEALPSALALLAPALKRRLVVVQQAREEDAERVRSAYAQGGISAEVQTFFRDLPRRMADAQLVIGRAGASTIAELTVIGRPAILVPLPHAVDNDQLNNAQRLAESGGCWCIEQKNAGPERLAREIAALMEAPDRREAMAKAARSQGRPDAVERLADLVEDLAVRRNDRIAPHADAR